MSLSPGTTGTITLFGSRDIVVEVKIVEAANESGMYVVEAINASADPENPDYRGLRHYASAADITVAG